MAPKKTITSEELKDAFTEHEKREGLMYVAVSKALSSIEKSVNAFIEEQKGVNKGTSESIHDTKKRVQTLKEQTNEKIQKIEIENEKKNAVLGFLKWAVSFLGFTGAVSLLSFFSKK